MDTRFKYALDSQNYYEYLQLVKSQFFKKKLRGKIDELKSLGKSFKHHIIWFKICTI